MKYTIIVMGSPYGSEHSRSALLFSRSLLSLCHTIDIVFFYGDGVLNADNMTSVATNEINLFNEWKNFYLNFKIPLHICMNSATKRGLIGFKQASMLGFKKSNIGNFFKISGFMELLNSIKKTDRFIQF